MFKTVPKEIKEEIQRKVKEGEKVTELAKIYGLSDKTIYRWMQNQIKPEISLIEHRRLKAENEELKRILGMVMLELERKKKGKNNK
jgi:DNA invertase Pin-like site-specific DNA recombinase